MTVIKPPKDDWVEFLETMNLSQNLEKAAQGPRLLEAFENWKSLKNGNERVEEVRYKRQKRWLIGHRIVIGIAVFSVILTLIGIPATIKNPKAYSIIIDNIALALNGYNIVIQVLAIKNKKKMIREYEKEHQVIVLSKFKHIWRQVYAND